MESNQVKVAVIGGGLAGLTGALYLARAGLEVHLFEKSADPGGRARSFDQAGLKLNLGAHALYADGAAHRILKELRIPYSGNMPDITKNDFVAGGSRMCMPTSAKALLLHREFSAREKWELIRVMTAIQNAKPAASELAEQSLLTWLHRRCKRPRVRNFFEGMFRLVTYSADLDFLSADIAIHQFQIGGAGVLYLDDGWQSLVDGMVEANRVAGTRMHVGSGVESLERCAADRWRLGFTRDDSPAVAAQASKKNPPGAGEHATAAFQEFDFVVLACEPSVAARLAGAHDVGLNPGTMTPARAACLDVGLSSLPQASGLVLDFDRRLYFAIHSNSARLVSAEAPAGTALIHTAKYLRQGESPESAREELESFLDGLQPGWRDRVIHAQFLPRIEVVKDQPDFRRGGLSGRVKTDCGARVGVYAAGDWVGDEGLLSDAAFASAKQAAAQIVARSRAAGIAREVPANGRIGRAKSDTGKEERAIAG
jgi:phytoene dehydrogenase-like protein